MKGWIIEDAENPAAYLSASIKSCGGIYSKWSPDIREALAFARKEDAQAFQQNFLPHSTLYYHEVEL